MEDRVGKDSNEIAVATITTASVVVRVEESELLVRSHMGDAGEGTVVAGEPSQGWNCDVAQGGCVALLDEELH